MTAHLARSLAKVARSMIAPTVVRSRLSSRTFIDIVRPQVLGSRPQSRKMEQVAADTKYERYAVGVISEAGRSVIAYM